jgi:hypothetical protein
VNRVISALAILAVSALVVGCTITSAGEPRPQDTSTSSTDSNDPPSSGELPPRPREIKLDDVDPCTLIPQADQSDYYIDEPGEPDKDDMGSAECVWAGTEVGYFGFTLRVAEGAEVWLDGDRVAKGELTEPILDFGAVTWQLPSDENACFVAVDVADGQQLIAQVGIDSPALDQVPPVCDYAHQLATSAMETLVES